MADNVFRVTLFQTMYGQSLQNVLHFSGPSSDPLQMSALADAVEANWVNLVRQVQAAFIQYTRISVRMMGSQFPPFDKTVAILGANSNTDQALTYYCHVIRLRTAFIGRRGRGRVYIGGLNTNLQQNGFLMASTLTLWAPRLASIMAAFGPGGSSPFRLGVTSKTNANGDFKEVTNIAMAPTPTCQRRRNIGIGV